MTARLGDLTRCLVEGCPTDLQNGRAGMLAHIKVVHFPHRSTASLAVDYAAELEELELPAGVMHHQY